MQNHRETLKELPFHYFKKQGRMWKLFYKHCSDFRKGWLQIQDCLRVFAITLSLFLHSGIRLQLYIQILNNILSKKESEK